MDNVLESLLSGDYMPHGHCYLWRPEILWLNVISDLLIATAYFSIPIALYYFVRKRPGLEFRGIFILFSLFILLCGITHVISVFVIWQGFYGVHGLAKLATAIISCWTAVKLFESIPGALSIPTKEEMQAASERINQEQIERLKIEAVQKQQALLRESTDSAHIGIFVVDEHGVITVANDAACDIFGYQKSEVENSELDKLLPVNLHQKHRQLVDSFVNGDETEKHMNKERLVKGVHKDGSEVPIEVRLKKRIHAGKTLVFASFQDISARLEAQRALESSEQMTRSIIDSLPLGLHVFTLNEGQLILTDYNQTAVEILGISHIDRVNKPIEEAFSNLRGTEIPATYRRIARDGGTWSNNEIAYEDVELSGSFEVICFQSAPNTAIVLFNDITEKLTAAQSIAAKERFIKAAFDASLTGIYIFNVDSKQYEYVNRRFWEITGLTLEGINSLDARIADYYHPDDIAMLESHRKQVLNANSDSDVFKVEYRLKHPDGHWVWLMHQDVVLERDEQNNVIRYVGSFIDVSDIKAMQDNLITLKEEAEFANEAKSEFLANMSHEIRTPMNAILGLTHLVLKMELGEKQYEYLSKVENSSKSLLNILNDILDYSKLEAGKLNIQHAEFDLEELLENISGMFSLAAEDKNIELIVDVKSNLGREYIGDQLRISQILNNLLGNAVKFTDEGYVRLIVNEVIINNEAGLAFTVEDTGIGMAEENIENLFTSFTQADTSSMRQHGGTGLGLPISRSLAKLMAGDITVKSTLGVGSEFVLTLPLKLGDNVTLNPDAIPAPMKTLLVDDNEASLLSTRAIIEEWGFEVDSCDNATRAIELVRVANQASAPYQLLIIDWRMPGMSGIDLVEQLETDASLSYDAEKFQVLMVTAYGKHYAEQRSKSGSIDGFLDKPIMSRRLRELLLSLQNENHEDHFVAKPRVSDSWLQQKPFKGLRALVAEDNETNQIVIRDFLAQLGFSLDIAENGEQAISCFTAHDYDIVLMDLQMPKMDGYTAAKLIRASDKGKTIPIIAVSAAVLPSDMERVAAAGMNQHLPKPIDLTSLIEVILKSLPDIADTPLQREQQMPNSSVIEQPINIAGFNVTKALDQLNGSQKLYIEILRSFLSDYQSAPEKLRALGEQRDFDAISRFIHTLAGVAGSIGATKLESITRQGEASIEKKHSCDARAIAKVLEEHIDKVAQALASHPSEQRVRSTGNSEHFIAQLAQLHTLISQGRFISAADVREELLADAPEQMLTSVETLIQAIDRLDYDECITVIDELMAKRRSIEQPDNEEVE